MSHRPTLNSKSPPSRRLAVLERTRIATLAAALWLVASAPTFAQFAEGDLYVASCGSEIYHVDPISFVVTPFSGPSDGLACASGVVLTHRGGLAATSRDGDAILEYSPSGGVSAVLGTDQGLSAPYGANGLAVDARGNLFVANTGASQILRFDEGFGQRSVAADAADGVVRPEGLAFDFRGNLLVANRDSGGQVLRVTRRLDAGGQPIVEVFDTLTGENPISIAVRANRDVYVLCESGSLFRYADGFSTQRILLGSYGVGGDAGIAASLDGSTLYHVSAAEGVLRRVDPDTGGEATVATGLTGAVGVCVVERSFSVGSLFLTLHGQDRILELDPVSFESEVFASRQDGLDCPSGITFLDDGRMLAASYGNDRIYRFGIEGEGEVLLDAGDGIEGPYGANGLARDAQGRVYVANFDSGEILRFSSDLSSSEVFAGPDDGLVFPDGLSFVGNGDLIVANRGAGGELLRFTPEGAGQVFDTIDGEECSSVVVRSSGDLYVACVSGVIHRYPFGVPALRQVLGSYGPGFGKVSLAFSSTDEVLYVATAGDESLREVDPVTGAARVVKTHLGDISGVHVFGSECPGIGRFESIGVGLAGSGGFEPSLMGIGDPTPGGTTTLQIRDVVGGAQAFFFFSFAREDISAFGGTIYVSFTAYYDFFLLRLPGPGGSPAAGDLDLPLSIPDSEFACLDFYFQLLAFDAGAPQGISMTNAVLMQIGE